MPASRIPVGFVLPSAAYTISRRHVAGFVPWDDPPRVGDIMYGQVESIGQHAELENKNGRIHRIQTGSRTLFVYGNRYAPDHFEAVIPDEAVRHADLVARSGVISAVRARNSAVKDPTKIRMLGRVVDPNGTPVNTRDHSLIVPSNATKRSHRARLILVCGTAMNAGKSMAATACVSSLASMGHSVRASKLTGTASLKDILHMNDAGARVYNDFSYFGHPSTYLLEEEELVRMFDAVDLKYANNPRNYWVVELADGILQRETALLLGREEVRSRIHRLVFCARDSFGCLGGIEVLKTRHGLAPDAISGIVSSSPLLVRELQEQIDVEVFDSVNPNLQQMSRILL